MQQTAADAVTFAVADVVRLPLGRVVWGLDDEVLRRFLVTTARRTLRIRTPSP
jgi:hypothetical protein